jgi:hypothetical protein
MSKVTIGAFHEEVRHSDLLVDGVVIKGTSVSTFSDNKTKLYFAHFVPEALSAMSPVSVGELLSCLESSTFYLYDNHLLNGWSNGRLEVYEERLSRGRSHNVSLDIQFGMERWNRPYTILELSNELEKLLSEESSPYSYRISDEQTVLHGFGINSMVDFSNTLGELLIEFPRQMAKLLQKAEGSLVLNKEGSIIRLFEFPDSIRPACEQYLLYFGQFLKDLGIDAKTEMKEESSRVLFTVTPTQKDQALDAIRDALNSYLEIPSSPHVSSSMTQSQEIAVIQLNANLLHLQSQVVLAGAVLQAKEATINAQQCEILTLKQSLDLRGYLPNENKTLDSEALIEGIVAVKKFEHKGIEFNLPEILRRLKRFRK